MDYNECCRSCIQPISDKVNLLTDIEILSLFEDCTRLKVDKEDALPKYLCSICYNKCGKWKEFQEECKQNENFLTNWCFNEKKTAVKTEIEFLDLGIKEESDSDDNGFDHMPGNDDNSCNESEDVKLNLICEVKLEDIGKGRDIATRSRVNIKDIVDYTSLKPKKRSTQVNRGRPSGSGRQKSILAPKRIVVTKFTNLSKLNVCNQFNYVERNDGESYLAKSRSKRSNNGNKEPNVPSTDFKAENDSEPVPSETNDLIYESHSETDKLNPENLLKENTLSTRKSTKRAYCEDNDNDENTDDDYDIMKSKKYTPTVFKCSFCREMFRKLQVYELHYLCVHLKREPFECTICYAKYARSETLDFHLLKTHIPTILTAKLYCGVCEQGFENEVQLKRHSKMHVIHCCDQCGKIFSRRKQLVDHIYNIHSNREKVLLKCNDCERTFLHKASLNAHVKQDHLKEFSFICSVCGKMFATNTKLLSHLKTHSEERPHVCTICSNAYKKKEKLKFHMTIHTGEKPFKCPHCDRTFRHNKVMKHHAMTHTGERPHVCKICNRGFIQKIALTKHMNSHNTI